MGFHKHIIFLTLLLCVTSVNLGVSQQSYLDEMVYGSDKDSILLKDYLRGQSNHLVLVPHRDCGFCSDYYPEYQQVLDHWSQDYNLQITLLVDRVEGNVPIEAQIAALELSTGLTVLLRDTFQFAVPNTLIVNGQLDDAKIFEEFLTVTAVEEEVQSLFNQQSTGSSQLLDRRILQCLDDLESCDGTTQHLYSCGDTLIDGITYIVISAYEKMHYIRESEDGRQVYLYHQEDEQDYLLLDFNGEQCDTMELYSVKTDELQSLIINEYTEVNGVESWILDLAFDCDQESTNLTLTYGQGTNAGLIPLYDEESVYTSLRCQYEDSQLTIGATDDCPSDKPDQLSQLKIYPNPTDGNLTIDAGLNKVEIIGLFTIEGRQLAMHTVQSMNLNLSDLPQGIYILAIEQNLTTTYHKIIKY